MRLVLDTPPHLTITSLPLQLKPDEPRAWLAEVARRDVPPGATAHIGEERAGETRDGWPLVVLDCEIRGADGVAIETRTHALYVFLEHATIASVRGTALADDALLAVLLTGRPDWTGALLPVARLWELEHPLAAEPAPALAARDDAALAAELAALDAAAPTAATHDQRGLVLAQLDRHTEAIAAWEASLALAPGRADLHYNLAQAHFLLEQYEPALAAFRAALAADPADVLVRRKVAQCLCALDRFDEADAERTALRDAWARSTDPAVRAVGEYVFDQFAGEGFGVHAIESLGPGAPWTFQAVGLGDGAERPLPAAVLVGARSATELAVALRVRGQTHVLGALPALPPYGELRREVIKLLRDALRAI